MITGMGDARIVRLSLRVYSLLLASYPQSFRQQYAPHMLQAFGDYTRRVNLQRGFPGMLWWWTLTLFDFLNSVVEEHLQRITSMTKEKFIRLGGWSLMLTAIVLFVSFRLGDLYNTAFGLTASYAAIENTLWLVTPLLLATGYAALRSQYQGQLGALGNVALLAGAVLGVISFIATLATIFLKLDNLAWPVIVFSLLSAMIAMMLFGIDALRERYLPRWGSFPFIAGLIPVLAFIGQLIQENSSSQITLGIGSGAPTLIDQLLEFAPLVFVAGLFLVGYMLQGEGKAAEKAA